MLRIWLYDGRQHIFPRFCVTTIEIPSTFHISSSHRSPVLLTRLLKYHLRTYCFLAWQDLSLSLTSGLSCHLPTTIILNSLNLRHLTTQRFSASLRGPDSCPIFPHFYHVRFSESLFATI